MATAQFLNGDVIPRPGAAAKDLSLDWDFQCGLERAKREAWFAKDPQAKKRWEILANAKPGNTIGILRACGQHTDDVTFRYVLERGTKFVWVGQSSQSASLVKFPLDVIALEDKADLTDIHRSWEAQVK